MINYFKIKDLCEDENGNTDFGYATIETPNPTSPAMIGFLAGFLNKSKNDVITITEEEFKRDYGED